MDMIMCCIVNRYNIPQGVKIDEYVGGLAGKPKETPEIFFF
jgi:hypothetical protein